MAFSINTNVASLQAQFYLGQTNTFQAKTINRVTSGLRIVNSGDDAAGLANANALRNAQAVLTQGIRNVSDAQAQLQTADYGINNIGHLLDRLNTLATEANTGTSTASPATLQSEFKSTLSEINRQADAIGLGTTDHHLANSLSIYVGGSNNATTSTVSLDMAGAKVNTATLGLDGAFVAKGAVDLSSDLVITGLAAAGVATFTFGSDDVVVSLSGVTSKAELTNSINSAIAQYGKDPANTAFAAQNYSASINASTGSLEFSMETGATIAGDTGAAALFDTSVVADPGSIDITTMAGAANALKAITAAVGNMGDAQAAVGKSENVLGYSLTLANSQLTNMAASESQIRDADLASEAANLSKAQVLTQAGVAALAQANSAPQAVLSLLKG